MLKKELSKNIIDTFLKGYLESEQKDTVAISLHMGAKEIKKTLYDYQLKENAEIADCTVDDLCEQMKNEFMFFMPFEFNESFKKELCKEISQKYGFTLHKVYE